jgi:hypothetical protein
LTRAPASPAPGVAAGSRALKIDQLRRARACGITAVRTENVDGNVPM